MRGRHRRGRAGTRAAGDGRLQRRDREGRHLLPDHRQEASARAGDRRGEPAPLRLSRGFGRGEPAEPGRGLSRPRPFRPHLLQSGADEREGHRPDRRSDGLLHGRRRLRAGDVGRLHHRPRPGHDLSRRPAAGEGGDGRGGHCRGPGGRRRAYAAVRRGGLSRRGRRSRAGTGTPGGGLAEHRPGRRARGGGGSGPRSRRDSRRRAGGPADTLRHSRGDRPGGRRQPLRRVQGAVRRDAGDRFRPYRRLAGRNRRQQRSVVQRERAEGCAFRRAVQPAAHPACLPAEYHRVHGRSALRERRDRAARCQDGDGGRDDFGPEDHHADRRFVRGGELRDGGAGVPAEVPVDLAQQPDQRHGRRAGGGRPCDGEARRSGTGWRGLVRRGGSRVQAPDDRDVRAAEPSALRLGAALGRRDRRSAEDAAGAGPELAAAANAPVEDTRFGVFRM